GRLGREDGDALASAAAAGDTAALDRIAGQLPAQGLTAAELDTLAAGGQVGTLPQSVRDYYAELYRAAGKDGVLALGDQLRAQEAGGDPNAGRALNSLANGLMVVSNENIGSGYNPDGSLHSPGSYDQLPSDLREVISTRTHGADANAIRYPGESGAFADQYRFHEDTRRLGELLKESEPGYAPGTEFARELTRQAANLAEGTALSGADSQLVEQPMRDYLEVSGRNHEAITQLLPGEGSAQVPLDDGYQRSNTITPLLQFDWSDDRGAPDLFGWIGENAIPGAEVSVEQSEQAGRAATGLISLVTDGTSGQFESMMNLPGHDGRSLGEVNPALTQQIAQAVTPYLGDMARGPELQTHGFDREAAVGEGGDVRSIRLATLMNTDPTASALFNGAIVERTNDYAGRFGELHGESSVIRYQLGEASGRLLGYMDQGLRAEAYDRGLDDSAAAGQSADRTKLAIDVATKTIVGLGGTAAIPLDIASSVVQAGMGSEKLTLPEEASEINADNLATQRAYRMLEAVVAKDPSILDGPDGTSTIPEGLRDERGLRPLSEIMDDDKRGSATVRTAAEEFLHRRGLDVQRFDLPLNSARDNQTGYVTDEAHYRSRILGGSAR
uniref:TPR repeat region-containing protein n=1 Tax=Rhodococcus sp. TaxID=1831 RepID=UPI003B8A712B